MTPEEATQEISGYYGKSRLYGGWYLETLADDLLYAVNVLGYERKSIPARNGNDGITNHMRFDYFYEKKDLRVDLRYVITPYNHIPIAPDEHRTFKPEAV